MWHEHCYLRWLTGYLLFPNDVRGTNFPPVFWQRLVVLLGMATERHDSELKMLERCRAPSYKDNISQMTTSQIITQNVHCFETALVTTAALVTHCCTQIKKKKEKTHFSHHFSERSKNQVALFRKGHIWPLWAARHFVWWDTFAFTQEMLQQTPQCSSSCSLCEHTVSEHKSHLVRRWEHLSYVIILFAVNPKKTTRKQTWSAQTKQSESFRVALTKLSSL